LGALTYVKFGFLDLTPKQMAIYLISPVVLLFPLFVWGTISGGH
jgi:hypothetical protein